MYGRGSWLEPPEQYLVSGTLSQLDRIVIRDRPASRCISYLSIDSRQSVQGGLPEFVAYWTHKNHKLSDSTQICELLESPIAIN